MVDVTVHGAGIFGLSVAWACARRGAKVRVIDPGGVGAGSSGGIVGALAPHTPENWNEKKQFQFDSLDMSESYWAGIAEQSGLDPGYARSGRVQPIMDEAHIPLARAREISAETLWQGRYRWQVVEAEIGTGWTGSPTGWMIHDTLSARIHPRQACMALAGALSGLGVEIVPDAAPSGLEVFATGYQGLLEISREIGAPVGNGVKGQAVLLDHDARSLPQLFADGLHIIPHGDGTTAIGSTSERAFEAPDRPDELLDDVLARARSVCPSLADAPILERWAGVRPRAKSRAPMLGVHPTKPGAFIANGGFKIGFGMAPMVGQVMADLMLEGRDVIPESFRPGASLPRS